MPQPFCSPERRGLVDKRATNAKGHPLGAMHGCTCVMAGPCGASSDAPVPLSRYANLYGPPSLIGVKKRKTNRLGKKPINLAAQVLPYPLTSTAPSELYDAAQSRQTALVNLLRLLADAPDLGAPTEKVLDDTFSALEYLAADAERLYTAAEQRTRP